jgi:hypothetical protein
MNFRQFTSLIVGSLILLPSAFGLGPLDTWNFRGVLTTGLPGSPYQAGLPYSVTFTVDTSQLTPNAAGVYFPTVAYSFFVNSVGFGASSLGSGVWVANDQSASGGGSFDGIVFSMSGDQSTGFPAGTLFDGSEFGVTLVANSSGPTATPFTDTSFPITLDLNQFPQRDMTVYFQSGPVHGTVDSLYLNGVLISQIPEPGVFSLLAGGMLGLCWQSFRRSSRSAASNLGSALASGGSIELSRLAERDCGRRA